MPIDPSIALRVQSPNPAPLGNFLQMAAQTRNLDTQNKLQETQLQQTQQEMQEQQKMRQAYMESGGDLTKLQQRAAQLGVGPKSMMALQQGLLAQKEKLSTIDANELKVRQDHTAAIGSAAQAVLQLPAELRPQGYQQARANMITQGRIKPEEAPEEYPGDEAMQLHANSARTSQQIIDSILKEREVKARETQAGAAATQADTSARRLTLETPNFNNTARRSGLEADMLQKRLDTLRNTSPADTLALVDQVVPPGIKGNEALNRRTKAMVSAAMSRGDVAGAQDAIKAAASEVRQLEVATDPRVQAAKIAVTVGGAQGRADAAGLTDDDYLRAGEQYSRTGVMPAMGRDNVTRGKIVHAGQQWARDNGYSPKDIVTMQAAYAGDKASLANFQKQRDQIVSFEQTAQKNLDLMLEKAKPLVDSGSRLINTPLRSINRSLLGSQEQAAFDAAMLVANNEVAKVTSGGGLGGVLSDSARHEVEQINPKTATLGQYIAVASVLRQDMANRHNSMDATLGDIKSRIGGGGQRTETPAAENPAVPQGKIAVISPEGVPGSINADKWDAAKKRGFKRR